MNVKDKMIKNPITISEDISVIQALHLMTENRIRHLIVIDSNNIIGIVSIRDIPQTPKQNLKVKDIMTLNPRFLKPNDSIEFAQKELHNKSIHCMPVLDNGKLVGIITQFDIDK